MHKYLTVAVVAAAAVGWAVATTVGPAPALDTGAALLKTLFLGALKLIIARSSFSR